MISRAFSGITNALASAAPRAWWTLALVLSFLCVGVPERVVGAPSDRLISVTDLFKVREIGEPTFSPDGKQVVYSVKSIVERPDRPGDYTYRTQLWLATVDGRTPPRQLTRGDTNATAPAWSPKGDRLAFVRRERDMPQIWILPLGPAGGGDPYPLTRFPLGADRPRWSPDGTRIIFSATLGVTDARREIDIVRPSGPMQLLAERPGRSFADTGSWNTRGGESEKGPNTPPAKPDGSLQEQREWLAQSEAEGNPRVTTRLEFLGEQDLEPTEAFTHLYVIDAEEGSVPLPLTPGFASYHDAEWYFSPTGLQILLSGDARVSEHPDRILERDLWLANPNGGPLKRLLHDEQWTYTAPSVSPDGSMIGFLAADLAQAGYGHTLLCVLPTRGGPRRFLTTRFDRSVRTFRWAPDSQSLYFTAQFNGATPLFRVPVAGGKIDRLTGLTQSVLDFDVRPIGIAAVITRTSNPYELYLINLKGDESSALTTHNTEWLRGKIVSGPERREINMEDGMQVDSWVIKPAILDPARKYPLLVEIHGGPQAMWGPAEPTMWHEFQYFAARGYGVVFCNPRGSSGYGYGFQRENFKNWGPGPGQDVLGAVEGANLYPWVDQTRQVIAGGSYGGYLTAWIISQDRRFKAAVAQRGVYELSIFFGEGNAWRLVPYHFGGYPWQSDVRSLLNAQSPLSQVAKITTPLLIIHGDSDLRAGVIQSEMLYKSLKVLGAPVEYVRYPGASHELTRSGDPKQRIDRLVRMDEFFQRFIGRVEP